MAPLISVVVLALAAALPAAASAEIKTSAPDHRYVPGEALVRYAPGIDASERRELRSAAETFRIGSTGRATVKVKLKKPALKQLKRKRKLKVKAKAVLKNAAGLTSSRTATIRLRRPRR